MLVHHLIQLDEEIYVCSKAKIYFFRPRVVTAYSYGFIHEDEHVEPHTKRLYQIFDLDAQLTRCC